MSNPKIRIDGIRGSIPPGYLLGRVSPGTGVVELISASQAVAKGLIPVVPSPPTGLAGGDLTGSYPDPIVAGLRGRNVSNVAPSNKNVLAWDNAGTAWAPLALGAVAYSNQYSDLTGLPSIHSIPNGGTTGQVLTKNSGTDYDVSWQNGGGGGGSSGGPSSFWLDTSGNIYVAQVDSNGLIVVDGSGYAIYDMNPITIPTMPQVMARANFRF